jgi:hypothetical protein
MITYEASPNPIISKYPTKTSKNANGIKTRKKNFNRIRKANFGNLRKTSLSSSPGNGL